MTAVLCSNLENREAEEEKKPKSQLALIYLEYLNLSVYLKGEIWVFPFIL